jgi:hypothetical protein
MACYLGSERRIVNYSGIEAIILHETNGQENNILVHISIGIIFREIIVMQFNYVSENLLMQ